MTAIAPLSVLLVGLLGLVVVLGAVARIVVLERRVLRPVTAPTALTPPAPYAGSGLAA